MKNIFINTLPATEEGAKLQLSDEIKERCKTVYKLDGKGGAVFSELWNPDKDYSDEFIIVPVTSNFKELSEEYPEGTNFANVKGSSKDVKHHGSWLELLKTEIDQNEYDCSTCCAEKDIIYKGNSDDERAQKSLAGTDFECTPKTLDRDNVVGGHVLMKVKNSDTVAEGGDVSLLPICCSHNVFHYLNEPLEAGTGYYMKLTRPMKAVVLENYLQLPADFQINSESE